MIPRRILVNLAAFLALFALLCVWAVRNVIRFDTIERPFVVTAEFETSPGLRSNFEVSYLGLRVGNIGRVRLVEDHVDVELKIDRGTDLPAQVRAAVRRKSAVGEPYVDLSPMGAGGADAGPRLRGGDVIPLERTSTPLSYGELFSSLAALVDAIPVDDLHTLMHETALALDGRGDDIRSILVDVEDLSATLAEDPELLPDIVDELSRFTATLAAHRDSIGAGMDNLAALGQALADSHDDLVALLERGPAFSDLADRLLVETSGELGCTLTGLAQLTDALDTVQSLDALARTMDLAPLVVDMYTKIRYDAPDGPWIDAAFQFNDGSGEPVQPYIPPHELPDPGDVPTCTQADVERVTGTTGESPAGSPGSPATTEADREPADDVAAPDSPDAPTPDSSHKDVDSSGLIDLLGKAIALLVVLGAILVVVRTRPWQRFGGRGGDGA